jgi:hypothetical protein
LTFVFEGYFQRHVSDSAFVEMIEKGLVVACQMCECSEMLFSNEIEADKQVFSHVLLFKSPVRQAEIICDSSA